MSRSHNTRRIPRIEEISEEDHRTLPGRHGCCRVTIGVRKFWSRIRRQTKDDIARGLEPEPTRTRNHVKWGKQ
jgi:hypothetical protein